MIPALEEVGALFESGEIFLPEMLISANAMKAAMEVLRPRLAQVASTTIGTYVIGSVAGDIHDIGKNMCIVMLEGAGFEVVDLGVNVPSEIFVQATREHRPDIVGMSAFLTTTVPEIARNLAAFDNAGLRESVKVMIGGAPITEQFMSDVGADGYAPDASAAARVAKAMVTPTT
jgi:5-methyltetrahydrofolate--homocysteine methyltransferase